LAVTSLWAIKGRIDHLIHYVENPEKTAAGIADADIQTLFDIVGYTTRPDKTEQRLFVDGINCIPEIAVQEMIVVKKQFRKEDGRLAYHGYMSFQPGEVTPEQCHEIGLQLAREMWGDKYQIVVATHLDRNHLHCHFAINSVSFADGRKYDRSNAEYARMRNIADRLCLERGLSVIQHPPKTKTPRMIYLAEKKGEPTRYNVFRQAIDRAIASALTLQQFDRALQEQGFAVKRTGKYWSIRIMGDDRTTRLYRLGERYTNEMITERILEGGLLKRVTPYYRPEPMVRRVQFLGSFNKTPSFKGIRAMYYRWLYVLGKLPRSRPHPPLHPLLWEEVRKLRRYSEQIRLLGTFKIDTAEQLQALSDSAQGKMDALMGQRTQIQNKLRRATASEIIENLKTEKTALTAEIVPLRKNLNLAIEIAKNTERIQAKLEQIRQLEQQAKHRTQSKSKTKINTQELTR